MEEGNEAKSTKVKRTKGSLPWPLQIGDRTQVIKKEIVATPFTE